MNKSILVPIARPFARRAILISIALGGMLVPLNSTMIAVALPDIMLELRVDVSAAGWLVTAYLITMAMLQLVAGKLGDQFGRRRLLLGGLIYFGLASLLAALSPDLPILLFARVQQAIAGATVVTNGVALAFEIVPEDRRGRDLGLVNAVIVLAAAGGPPLGGLLVGVGGWRAIFWASIPLVIAALILGWSAIPAIKSQLSKNRLGLLETVSLFHRRTFACANGAIALSNLTMYVTLLAIPILLSHQVGSTSLLIGLVLASMSAMMAVLSPVGGRVSDRYGRRLPSFVGLTLLTLGGLPLAILGETTTMSMLLICLGLAGIGLGLSGVSLQTAVLESVEPHQAGAASGISSTSRYVGSIVGSSILANILGSVPGDAGNFRLVFLVVTLAAGGAALMSWGIHSEVKSDPPDKRKSYADAACC